MERMAAEAGEKHKPTASAKERHFIQISNILLKIDA
jgi:hypothetical protein